MSFAITLMFMNGCKDMLEPEPIDQLVNDIVLNEPKDIEAVEIGLYEALRSFMPEIVIAGDFTADHLLHNGTFSQYREIGVKRITSANASAAALWGGIYRTVYIANFMLERIPEIPGVSSSVRTRSMATAHFLRGMANFYGVVTYGAIPMVITTNIEENRNIGRTPVNEMLAFIERDFIEALDKLPPKGATPAIVSNNAVRAALARFYLYQKNYAAAESYADAVINSGTFSLEADFNTVVIEDFTSEAIFEVGYTIADDNDGNNLNTLFVGRREIIPSNQVMVALTSREAGRRRRSAKWDSTKVRGNDTGWRVIKYGTAIEDNNNVVVFSLPEMFLIRAEARALQGKVTGANSAQTDMNVLRLRAAFLIDDPNDTINIPPRKIKDTINVASVSQAQMIQLIEEERRYELAFEGHRWYDLRRTGRINQVMPAFNSNWRPAFELWPVPQREIQNNPALADAQNPGY
jgi:hypothetical protein